MFQLGDFTLSSGARSKWKIECDAWTDEDVCALAQMIRQLVGPFSSVEGVPRGGLRLAEALKPFSSLGADAPILIVDDVLTTGKSLEKAKAAYLGSIPEGGMLYERRGSHMLVGAVVFARGQCPSWIKAVFQMPECFWLEKRKR